MKDIVYGDMTDKLQDRIDEALSVDDSDDPSVGEDEVNDPASGPESDTENIEESTDVPLDDGIVDKE